MKIKFLSLFCFLSYLASAQIPNCIWSAKNSFGIIANDWGGCNVADDSGNVYVSGFFQTPNNSDDIFLIKYNTNGTPIWTKTTGGDSFDRAQDITCDKNGNIYITGFSYSTQIIFGNDTLFNPTGLFLVKYDKNGNALWAKTAYTAVGTGVSTDLYGNVFVSGYFQNPTTTFDTITIASQGLNYTIFIAKYDSNGNILWAKSAGGVLPDISWGIATDNNGNAFITGSFRDSVLTFGTISILKSDSTLTYNDLFITKYSPTGNVLWAKSAGGAFCDDWGAGVAIDNNNVLITGKFCNNIFLDSTIIYQGSILSAKLDSNGAALWAKTAGSGSWDGSTRIATDNSSNVYITGSFSGSTIQFGSTTLINAFSSESDIFVAVYDSFGNNVAAERFGDISGDIGTDISLDKSGNIFLSGHFASPSIKFDQILNNFCPLCSPKTYDNFIVKFGSITAVDEEIKEINISLSPNPTTGTFTIASETIITEIRITNLLGEMVLQQTVNRKQETVNLAGASGIYFLTVKTNRGTAVRKIIKQ